MRLIIHLFKLVYETLRFSLATRRAAIAIVLLLGLALLALTLAAQVAAPLALYPFA